MNQEEMEEMRLLNGFSDGLFDGFLHWVGGTTLVLRGMRTLKREKKKTWNDKMEQIFIGGW